MQHITDSAKSSLELPVNGPSPTKLSRNQKKKRRFRLAKYYKLINEENDDATKRQKLMDHTDLQQHPATQRPASDTSTIVNTLENIDHRAREFSAITSDANIRNNDADVQHTPQPAQPASTFLSSPFPTIPEESAASADNDSAIQEDQVTPPAVAAAATHAIVTTATTALSSKLPPAPPLSLVAPIGKDGKRVFLFGNYHKYYGYRKRNSAVEDPRLTVFERSWFAKKRCMDVGCNEGIVTLDIATRFGPRSMIGVDLDEQLIKRACSHLRTARGEAGSRAAAARRSGTPAAERRAAKVALAALAQTWFVHADFMAARADPGSVDVVTALSVTKWIHLHNGDEGMRAFFGKIHSLLSPGGLFLLEPQPWKSYKVALGKIKKHVEGESSGEGGGGGGVLTMRTLEQLHIRPENFVSLLSQEFGFRLVRELEQPAETAAGFDRPMYLLKKA